MSGTAVIMRVRPDPRGRIAIGRALAEAQRRIVSAIAGFEVLVDDAGEIRLRPLAEVPADSVITLGRADWDRLCTSLEAAPAPTPEALAAAREYRDDKARGAIRSELG